MLWYVVFLAVVIWNLDVGPIIYLLGSVIYLLK